MQFAVTAGKGVKRVTDYLLQQHHKLSEPFWQIGKGNGAPHANSVKLHAVLLLSFGNLLKGLK
jgi:hypothetical protein